MSAVEVSVCLIHLCSDIFFLALKSRTCCGFVAEKKAAAAAAAACTRQLSICWAESLVFVWSLIQPYLRITLIK